MPKTLQIIFIISYNLTFFKYNIIETKHHIPLYHRAYDHCNH